MVESFKKYILVEIAKPAGVIGMDSPNRADNCEALSCDYSAL